MTVSLVSNQFDNVENDYFFILKKQAEKIALVNILGTPTSTANQATSHFMGQRCEQCQLVNPGPTFGIYRCFFRYAAGNLAIQTLIDNLEGFVM